MKLLMPFLLLLVLLLCCSGDYAGTTSSSEVTNGVAVVIVDSAGKTDSARVALIHSGKWYGRVRRGESVVDYVAENAPVVGFTNIDTGTYSIIARTEAAGARRSVQVRSDEDRPAETLRLAPLSEITGELSLLDGSADSIRLEGTDYVTPVDSDGGFSFSAVAGSTAAVVAFADTAENAAAPAFAAGLPLVPGTHHDLQKLQGAPGGILLDDFNDGNKNSIVGWYTGHGVWYAYDDAGKGGNSRIFPEQVVADFATALTGAGAYQGLSADVRFVMGDAISVPHASIACQLTAESDEYVDLRDLEQITFYARGSGDVRMNLVTHAADSYEPVDIRGDFGVTLSLTEEWRKITIPADSLHPEPEGAVLKDGLQWHDAADSVRSIVFGSWSNTPGDTIDLSLDDVVLHGITPVSFQK